MRGRTALRWSGYVAVAVIFAIACVMLSNWQFARGAERDAELAIVAANYEQDAVALDALIPVGSAFDADDEWRPVAMTGEYVAEDTLLVRNRPRGGTSAFEVLVPFRTDDGRIVIVDRGWVPPGKDRPEPDVVPAPPSGEVTVTGRLQPGEMRARNGRSAPDGQVATIDLPLISDTIGGGGATVTDAYVLMSEEDPAAAERPNALEAPSEDPGPHLSYAIQWILFAVMGFAFIWYMIATERKHRREDAEVEAGLRERAPKVARRDRDMQAEDELLDTH
ncbi:MULTISPECIES: SURF1 family protein [unclassified Microbacterium]|uniref:SURF1 family cytochrome oxidase biogenesis protein n=1 Tax=unclassified Microbacterium TaxID=2609290 RepID=UPI00386982D1